MRTHLGGIDELIEIGI